VGSWPVLLLGLLFIALGGGHVTLGARRQRTLRTRQALCEAGCRLGGTTSTDSLLWAGAFCILRRYRSYRTCSNQFQRAT
jgi:hypothetical protein